MRLYLLACLSSLLWLLPAASNACAVCRPKVQAAIHNADYSVNVALLLLPVALLLAVGVGLYYAEALVAWAQQLRRPVQLSTIDGARPCL